MGPIAAIKLAWFILDLLIDYGPSLVKLGRKAYWKVEELFGNHAVQPDPEKRAEKKQEAFRDLIQADRRTWVMAMGYPPANSSVDTFRQKIWERENWGTRRRMKTEAIRKAAKARKEARRR
jgi:hypothetical protein